MTVETWVEWQAKATHDPFDEQRADQRSAMIIEHLYKATYQAVGRIIALFADNHRDDYPYESLPNYGHFMPYISEELREKITGVGQNRYDEPFDPNEMTEEQFAAMFGDVNLWQEFLGGVDPGVRIVHLDVGD